MTTLNVALLLAGFALHSPEVVDSGCQVKIQAPSSPRPGALPVVGFEEEARGAATLGPDQYLWVFTSAEGSATWSPTGGPVPVIADRWQVRVHYGSQVNDDGIVFLLRVMVVDKTAHKILIGMVKSRPTLAIPLDAVVQAQCKQTERVQRR